MEINNIGNNAGVIWNALNANGKMTEAKLKKESGHIKLDHPLFEYSVQHMCQPVASVEQLSFQNRREVVYELVR